MNQSSRRTTILAVALGAAVLGMLAVPTAGAAGRPRGSVASPTTQIAYLHVLQDGTVDRSQTKNVGRVSSDHNGLYCIDVAFTPKTVTATMSDEVPSGPLGTQIFAGLPPTMDLSCSDPQANAGVFTFIGNTSSPGVAFFAMFVG